ncbi:MAG: hypothetical protein WCA10_17035 [Terracidiphilus sp.]
MTFNNRILVTACFLVFASLVVSAQQSRPALIPLAQGTGGGGSSSAASAGNIGGLSDGPITAGETVHINVFDAPDFSLITRVSESGDIPYRFLVGAKLRELEQAVERATSEDELRSEIARLTRQKLTSPS